MNKFIKSDIANATGYMRAAIMESLYEIDSGQEEEIDLGSNISWNLFYECLKEAGWKDLNTWDTNGWEVDFWCTYESPSGKQVDIQGSLWCGLNYIIRVKNDN